MKILEYLIFVVIGFVLTKILENLLKGKDTSQLEKNAEIAFKHVTKTPEFKTLLISNEFNDVIKTSEFKKFVNVYGKYKFVNMLAG